MRRCCSFATSQSLISSSRVAHEQLIASPPQISSAFWSELEDEPDGDPPPTMAADLIHIDHSEFPANDEILSPHRGAGYDMEGHDAPHYVTAAGDDLQIGNLVAAQ